MTNNVDGYQDCKRYVRRYLYKFHEREVLQYIWHTFGASCIEDVKTVVPFASFPRTRGMFLIRMEKLWPMNCILELEIPFMHI